MRKFHIKHIYRKIFLFFLITVIFIFQLQPLMLADTEKPYINARAFVLMDRNSGRILYSKNQDLKLPMASTTKIMTAIIALEKGSLGDMVLVSKKATRIGGSKFYLKEGQKISLKSLLYGLLLCSGNDAAIAIAEHIGGSVENFVNMMNSKAAEIGAYNTHFANPHGLDDPEHYTTAKDLAIITRYALNNPVFCEIVSTKEIEIIERDFRRRINNTNKLLRIVDYVNGVKTGYTGKAGKCLVASATLKDVSIISVILDSQNHFKESLRLINFGLKSYRPEELVEENKVYTTVRVKSGIRDNLDLIASEKIIALVNEDEKIEIKNFVPDEIKAPIRKGQDVGELCVFINGELSYKVKLQAAYDLRRKSLFDILRELVFEWARF